MTNTISEAAQIKIVQLIAKELGVGPEQVAAAVRGLGSGLSFDLLPAHRGQIFNLANIVDSLMPTINNRMSRIEMILVDDYCVASAIACVPPTACIANAIYNATDVRVTKLPLSPKNVLRALMEVADFLDLHYASIC